MYDDPWTGATRHDSDHADEPAVPMTVERPRSAAIGEARSPNEWICPFLRAIDDKETLGLPVEAPDPANRCAALRGPVPQSLRQQELVCLTSGHVNCPRYLRGSMGTSEPVGPTPVSRSLTPATAGALVVFALAFVASVGFVVANGGLALSEAGSTPGVSGNVLGDVTIASPTLTASATAASTPIPSPSPDAFASLSPTASPTPTASLTPSASAPPSATPGPTPKATPRPTSNRYALLKPCPNTPNCYLYVIRSGDNLYSIANYFGVSATTVQARNPWTAGGLTVGRSLRLPPPTR